MPINRERLGAEYPTPTFDVTAERIAAFADATRDSLDAYRGADAVAPPVFAVVPAWGGVTSALADESLGVDVGRTVHGEQHMRLHRPIRSGDVLSTVGRLASIEERGANEFFVIALETRDAAGEPVAGQEVVVVSRGTASGAGASSAAPATKPRPEPEEVPPPALERTVDLDPGITFEYARASGDENRIHLDDDFAREMGLPGIIVHGLCLLSIALQPVVAELGGGDPGQIRSVSVRFARPIQPGQPFTTRVWTQGDAVSFESVGPDGGAILRNGRVELATG